MVVTLLFRTLLGLTSFLFCVTIVEYRQLIYDTEYTSRMAAEALKASLAGIKDVIMDTNQEPNILSYISETVINGPVCYEGDRARYVPLKGGSYFFALNLYNSEAIIPRVLQTIAEVCFFLGYSNCHISIYENRSSDRTSNLLRYATDFFEDLGFASIIILSERTGKDPASHNSKDRIEILAGYRNRALAPMYKLKTLPHHLVFLNDVWLCPEQIFELLHQHVFRQAEQSCGMDWFDQEPVFWDNWAGRTMRGDLFYEAQQPHGTMDKIAEQYLFETEPDIRRAWQVGMPFQVYSCWNGVTVLNPATLVASNITFRRSRVALDECN